LNTSTFNMQDTMAKISEKVSDAVSSMPGLEKVMNVQPTKERTVFASSAEDRSKPQRPTSNRAMVWMGPKKVAIKDIGYPKMNSPSGKPMENGVILKVIASGICGSDLHMYRGSMPVPPGTTFGHEVTGKIIEMGKEVENFDVGDYVSVPFNIACGRCMNCRLMKTSACLNVNPQQPGGAYGYAMMGGWTGGQAEYLFVPYADFNLLKLPKDLAIPKMAAGFAFLSDIYPTGYNGAVQAGVQAGSIVYIAGAGPVGLCAARSAFLLGAAAVFISDIHEERLRLAESIGCKTIDLKKISGGKHDAAGIKKAIEQLMPTFKNGPYDLVDCAIDCVGFEACGCGNEMHRKHTEQSINTCFQIVKAGGKVGIPGVYPNMDVTAPTTDNKQGITHLAFGDCWMRALSLGMGQCPVNNSNFDLMKTIIYDQVDLSRLLNVKYITLDEVPEAYSKFNEGEPVKYVVDPHGTFINQATMSK